MSETEVSMQPGAAPGSKGMGGIGVGVGAGGPPSSYGESGFAG